MDKNSSSHFSFHSLDLPIRIGFIFMLVVNMLVILTYKLLILRWTMNMGIKRAISIMTLIDESEKLMACALMSAVIIFDTIYGRAWVLENIPTCPVRFMGMLGNNSLFYSGLAISVMRLIYIQGRVF